MASTTFNPEAGRITSGMRTVLIDFAASTGYATDLQAEYIEDADGFEEEVTVYRPSTADVIRALRQPVSLAAAFADLCRALNVDVLPEIAAALTDADDDADREYIARAS